MAHFLFIDESGQDGRESPCEVLAGISVEDLVVWEMINEIISAENRYFGCRYGRIKEEFKGKKFLKKKIFRHAAQEAPIPDDERRVLAHDCIFAGPTAARRQITALAQAKLAFVEEVLGIAKKFRCNAFASVVKKGAPRPDYDALRKDYAFLFERFYYFLEDRGLETQGIIVFDELEKSQSKVLLDQMEQYFLKTGKGQWRARQIIPQPFFVHSDLTTLIQVADLIAYIISWGFEMPETFLEVTREELRAFGEKGAPLRYRTTRKMRGKDDFYIWSFAAIEDLRSAK
jgi:hypothetical protein